MSSFKEEVELVINEIDNTVLNCSNSIDPLFTLTPRGELNKSLLPQCCDIAQKYLLTPVQNAAIERTFSLQNLIITIISNVGMKLFIKYCKFILTQEEIEEVLKKAALLWLTEKKRRN